MDSIQVNIFEKDFIIVLINKNEHWFVCIICFPGYRGAVREDGGRWSCHATSL